MAAIAAVGLDVHGRQGLDGGPLGGIEVPLRDEMVGEGARLVAGPGVESGDELRRLDQPGLQGEQAEEEMAVGGDGGHEESPFREAAPDGPATAVEPGRAGRRIGRIIARGSAASIPAVPVPIAPGGVRLLAQIAHT